MTRSVDAAKASLHLLIVDDNISGAQTTGWIVELMGHTYELADGKGAAIARAEERAPDVVILDIGLPGANGFEVCRDMKAMPGLADTMFIAHSGYSDEKIKTRAAEVGFAHFLLKPFEAEDLEALLTLAAEQRSARRDQGA